MALGSLFGFTLSGRALARGWDPLRLAGAGLVVGINAFLLVLFAGPFGAPLMLYAGALTIGVGRIYVDFMEREGLTAQGLVDEFDKFRRGQPRSQRASSASTPLMLQA